MKKMKISEKYSSKSDKRKKSDASISEDSSNSEYLSLAPVGNVV